MVEVRRDAATLLSINATNVRPGTIVYSDEWAAYSQLSTTVGFVHRTVNHSLHFVDPDTGTHNQGVEGACKRMMREDELSAFRHVSTRIYAATKVWWTCHFWPHHNTHI